MKLTIALRRSQLSVVQRIGRAKGVLPQLMWFRYRSFHTLFEVFGFFQDFSEGAYLMLPGRRPGSIFSHRDLIVDSLLPDSLLYYIYYLIIKKNYLWIYHVCYMQPRHNIIKYIIFIVQKKIQRLIFHLNCIVERSERFRTSDFNKIWIIICHNLWSDNIYFVVCNLLDVEFNYMTINGRDTESKWK